MLHVLILGESKLVQLRLEVTPAIKSHDFNVQLHKMTKISECNCACCDCNKLHNKNNFWNIFVTLYHKLSAKIVKKNCCHIFLFWVHRLSLCFQLAMQLIKTKLTARISSESLESMFVMQFVAVATCKVLYDESICCAIKLGDKITCVTLVSRRV